MHMIVLVSIFCGFLFGSLSGLWVVLCVEHKPAWIDVVGALVLVVGIFLIGVLSWV